MGYVRTPEEIDRIQELTRRSRFTLEGISIEFETTDEFVRSVLPPCLEPDGARGLVTVSRWQSAVCGEFESTAVMVNARWDKYVGTYFLNLIVSGDMPITLGRQLWGEPKKRGDSQLYRDGDNVYGYCERNGTRIVQIDAVFTEELGPQVQEGYTIEVDGPMGHDASLTGDPFIASFLNGRKLDSLRRGTGDLTLTSSDFDPVGDIPIISIGQALHYTGESFYEEVARTYLSDRDAYLPYILGRGYDDLSKFRVPLRHRAGLLEGATR